MDFSLPQMAGSLRLKLFVSENTWCYILVNTVIPACHETLH